MIKIGNLVEQKYKIFVCIFFLLFLLIGIGIYKDYGISRDEPVQRDTGIIALEYVMGENQNLLTYRDKYYGQIFEILLVIVERALHLTQDIRLVYLMRHLVNFLAFFTGVVFFYRLCKFRFNSWKVGLLGSLFLILSPRIFADSFYNSKDLIFLSVFIISIYTLVTYLDNKSLPRAAIHALTCAFLIDIRILGIMVPLLTIIFFISDLFIIKLLKLRCKKTIGSILLYMCLLIFFTIIFWPTLWHSPVYNFIEAFKQMSHYPFIGTNLYLGDYIRSSDIPWHYVPVWIAITTPLLYTALFLVGCFYTIKLLIKNPAKFYIDRRYDLIFMLWFFLPLVSVIVMKSYLYNAWRQMFFIYPGLLIISMVGLTSIFKFIKTEFRNVVQKIISVVFIVLISFSLVNTGVFMVRYHPHQNVYFNILAGKNMKEVKYNFDLDYWGLSYRQALEYILKNDKGDDIKVCVANPSACGKINVFILPSEDRNRLIYVDDPEEADYFISNYRYHRDEYSYEHEYFSIKVGGEKIMVVYKL